MQIAWDYLERTCQIDDPAETNRFLIDKVEFMIGQGQRNKLLLSNRAMSNCDLSELQVGANDLSLILR